MSKISIIVPVYYNADTLELLYADLKEKVLGKIGDYELVFVDDGSGDNSWEIIQKIAAMDKNVVCTKLSRNFGEHAAILAGLSVCTGDCALTKQADLQEDSTLILDMYESWKRGNKVVLAIRESRDENAVKKFFAGCYYWLVRKTINKEMPQGGCDCYLVDRQVIKVLQMMDEKNSSLTLQVMWVGFKTEKIYFHRKDREIGKSRWTLAKKFKLVVDSMMSFTYFPIRAMATMGFIFALCSLIGIILVIREKLVVGTPIVGYASTMCIILFGFGMLFIMMSILGEYIWRALEEARNRPPFIIDEVKRQDDEK
ncbi:MAG: glycosyltransferase family 2 protein [Butyrivibrio sp.]|nr:glycosyltransferase family 2 protein [Butyrivibrio sp.]